VYSPTLGITIGDPSGIGPEVAVRALDRIPITSQCKLVLYGDENVVERVLPIVCSNTPLNVIASLDEYKEENINLIS
jgi:4-hydroxy-L-threonine phosphate dehydrogenase PdxA